MEMKTCTESVYVCCVCQVGSATVLCSVLLCWNENYLSFGVGTAQRTCVC